MFFLTVTISQNPKLLIPHQGSRNKSVPNFNQHQSLFSLMTQPGGGTYVRIQAVYLIQNVYTMLEILLTPVSSNLDIYIFLPFHPCYIQGGIRLRVQLKIANPVPYLSPIRMCLSDTENCVSIPSPLKKKKTIWKRNGDNKVKTRLMFSFTTYQPL